MRIWVSFCAVTLFVLTQRSLGKSETYDLKPCCNRETQFELTQNFFGARMKDGNADVIQVWSVFCRNIWSSTWCHPAHQFLQSPCRDPTQNFQSHNSLRQKKLEKLQALFLSLFLQEKRITSVDFVQQRVSLQIYERDFPEISVHLIYFFQKVRSNSQEIPHNIFLGNIFCENFHTCSRQSFHLLQNMYYLIVPNAECFTYKLNDTMQVPCVPGNRSSSFAK